VIGNFFEFIRLKTRSRGLVIGAVVAATLAVGGGGALAASLVRGQGAPSSGSVTSAGQLGPINPEVDQRVGEGSQPGGEAGAGSDSTTHGNPPANGPALMTEYTIPAGLSEPHGVAKDEGVAGSRQGHALFWFTVLLGGALVRLDPDTGMETTYRLPVAPGVEVVDVRVTPTGLVWFNTGDGAVGVLNPKTNSGTIYHLGLGFMDWLHRDQFGNLWSAELGGNRIVVLDPNTGIARTWAAGLHSTGLTRRLSGDVWWCQRGDGRIGRLDPATNEVTHYTTPFSAIEGCAADPIGEPNGLVWTDPGFTGTPHDGVGALNPQDLTFTLYHTPTARSNPYGVAIGCGHSVVFGEDAASKIAVLMPKFATGTTTASTPTITHVTPVTIHPIKQPFTVKPQTSQSTVTHGPSVASTVNGFSEYPTLTRSTEGPHLVFDGPDQKIGFALLGTVAVPQGKIGLLELPPSARCQNQ
jgi:streptogramin lyase